MSATVELRGKLYYAHYDIGDRVAVRDRRGETNQLGLVQGVLIDRHGVRFQVATPTRDGELIAWYDYGELEGRL